MRGGSLSLKPPTDATLAPHFPNRTQLQVKLVARVSGLFFPWKICIKHAVHIRPGWYTRTATATRLPSGEAPTHVAHTFAYICVFDKAKPSAYELMVGNSIDIHTHTRAHAPAITIGLYWECKIMLNACTKTIFFREYIKV